MTSSVHFAMRYGIWEAPCYRTCSALQLRITPRSKQVKVISPIMVTDALHVSAASSSGFTVEHSPALHNVLHQVTLACAGTDIIVPTTGSFTGTDYSVYSPKLEIMHDTTVSAGDTVRVRFRIHVSDLCTGEHRLVFQVTDVMLMHRAVHVDDI